MMRLPGGDGLIEFNTVGVETDPVKSRTKVKTSDKPASPRKTAIARLVASSEPNIDDEVEDRQRGGVQSLGRAFGQLRLSAGKRRLLL